MRDVAADWQALREGGSIQFAPVQMPAPPSTPGWLQRLGEWLAELIGPLGEALGSSWPIVRVVLIALGALLVLFLLWLLLRPVIERLRERRGVSVTEPEWTPDRQSALALLEDADRLAREGRYAEAVHLLLQRSVGHIGEARPDWLQPASTSREIATLPMLPERARAAFSVIAARVERSLFALRDLDRDDWQAARSAYSDFALADLKA